MSSHRDSRDLIDRSHKATDPLGTLTFVGLRAADPFLQYRILKYNWGNLLIERLGSTTLPSGPAWITNTALDRLALSPYRSILLAMCVGSVLKQNIHHLWVRQERMDVAASAAVGALNAGLNSINSLLFICSHTSASVNGEHFPQTPLIVGSTLYVLGLSLEFISELQRSEFKGDTANNGKIYSGGLFRLSRHINYFGYTLWRGGYALAAGGWVWGATVTAFFAWDFVNRAIPVLQDYLREKYGAQYTAYEKNVPYKFVPYLY